VQEGGKGEGMAVYSSLYACSIVSSMFLSFNSTNQSLCRSWLLLSLSSSCRHSLPTRTAVSPRCGESSKNSESSLRGEEVCRREVRVREGVVQGEKERREGREQGERVGRRGRRVAALAAPLNHSSAMAATPLKEG